MKQLSYPSIIAIIIFTIACFLLRFSAGGWILFMYCWLIIPAYAIHFWGQLTSYFREDLTSIDKALVYISTILFLFMTLFQNDFDDSRPSYWVADIYLQKLGVHANFPEPTETVPTIMVIIFAIDVVLNIYLIWKSRKKKSVSNSVQP